MKQSAAQTPLLHTSPAAQAVPSGAVGLEHVPDVVSQVPVTWHASLGVQVTGFEPVQIPTWQVSVWVQALPSSHFVPLGAVGFEHAPVVGSQVPAT